MLRPGLMLFYALCLPLAIFAGFLLANPTTFTSFSFLSLVFCLLLFPFFIRGHHSLLIFGWNSYLVVFFLPGEPTLGVVLAVGSLGMAILNQTLRKSERFIRVPSVSVPLIGLTLVILVTIILRGGIGSRALGSEAYGGKRYLLLLGAIIGYFALSATAVPRHRRILMASLFFLSGLTAVVSDIAYALGPSFYFLFIIFSSMLATLQATTQDVFVRYTGVTWACLALCFFLLMRFGIQGLLDLTRPWRLCLFATAIAASLFGGFRSSLIIVGIIVGVLFYFEGLFRTKFLPIFISGVIIASVLVLPFVDKLPLSVQRSLSFLPINVDAMAKSDAVGTLDWRLSMWRVVVPEIPAYLLLGKGFNFSATDFYLTQEAARRGLYNAYESTLVQGNYHNGLLTLVIPFGIFGVIFFAWFCIGAIKVLYRNYRFGESELRTINTFLLSFFIGRLVFYVFFYGQLELDMSLFTGAIGMSVTLNNGVRSAADLERESVAAESPEAVSALQPA